MCSVASQTVATLGTTADPMQSQSGIAIDAAGDIFGTQFVPYVTAGQIFEIPAGTTTPQVIATFPNDFAGDGSVPYVPTGPLLRDTHGDLFGLTSAPFSSEYANEAGALWELPAGASVPVLLQRFDNPYSPGSLTMDGAGDLYGSARVISSGAEVWFEYPADGSGLRQLTASSDGGVGDLVVSDAAGDLFGIAASGSGGWHGEDVQYQWHLIEIPAAAVATAASVPGAPATPVAVSADIASGMELPLGLSVDTAGDVYATQWGQVLVLRAGTTAFRTLANLPGNNGNAIGDPNSITSDPLVDANGDVFVLAWMPPTNGAASEGEVLELPAGSATFMTLGTAQNAEPVGLIPDASGNLDWVAFGTGTDIPAAVFAVTGQPFAPLPMPVATPTNASPLQPTIAAGTQPISVVDRERLHGRVTVAVTNAASTVVTGVDTVALYATTDGTIDATAERVGILKRRLHLSTGSQGDLSIPLTAAPAAVGAYTLVARVTDATGRTATSAVGPILTVAARTVSLSVGVINAPARVRRGGPLPLTLAATNDGNIPWSGWAAISIAVATEFSPSSTEFGPTVSQRLTVPPEHSVRFRVSPRVAANVRAGVYSFEVMLNDGSGSTSALAGSLVTVLAPG
jgi:hypothetical protein